MRSPEGHINLANRAVAPEPQNVHEVRQEHTEVESIDQEAANEAVVVENVPRPTVIVEDEVFEENLDKPKEKQFWLAASNSKKPVSNFIEFMQQLWVREEMTDCQIMCSSGKIFKVIVQ